MAKTAAVASLLAALPGCSLIAGSSDALLFSSLDTSTTYLAPDAILLSCTGAPELRLAGSVVPQDPPRGVRVLDDTLAVDTGTPDGMLILKTPSGDREVEFACLPEKFPKIVLKGRLSQWVVLQNLPVDPSIAAFRILLDEQGFPRWFEPAEKTADVFFHEGDLYRFKDHDNTMPTFADTPGYGYERSDLDGHSIADIVPAEGPGLDHHALVPLPGERSVGIVYDTAVEDLSGWGVLPVAPQLNEQCEPAAPGPSTTVLRGRVVELDARGKALRSWRAGDHIKTEQSPEWVNIGPAGVPKCVLDVEHLNALSYHAPTDTLVITGRHLDGAVALRWATGEILWSIGLRDGPAPLRIVNDPDKGPSRPHDGLFDGKTLSFFDNRPGSTPRVVVYRIDAAKHTATVVRDLDAPCPEDGECRSVAMGAARPVHGGSRYLVSLGTSPLTAAEIDARSGKVTARLTVKGSFVYRVTPLSSADRATADAWLMDRRDGRSS